MSSFLHPHLPTCTSAHARRERTHQASSRSSTKSHMLSACTLISVRFPCLQAACLRTDYFRDSDGIVLTPTTVQRSRKLFRLLKYFLKFVADQWLSLVFEKSVSVRGTSRGSALPPLPYNTPYTTHVRFLKKKLFMFDTSLFVTHRLLNEDTRLRIR